MTEFYWSQKDRVRVRTCRSCSALRQRERKQAQREHYRERGVQRNLRVKYGITVEQWESLLEAQRGRCAICAVPIGRTTAHVDHCHNAHTVRGLLCFRCNTGLGKFGDRIEVIAAAIRYLEAPPPKVVYRPKGLTLEERRESRARAATQFHRSDRGRQLLARRAARSTGDRNPAAKIDDQAVVALRDRYSAGGISQAALAREFGVSQSLVSLIVLNKIRILKPAAERPFKEADE